MYLYFDNVGNLKEIINDIPARVGSSNVNTIYAYWEGLDPTYTLFTTTYVLNNGAIIPDEPLTPEIAYIISENSETTQIQPNDKRDLYFFKYGKDYKFIKFVIPDEVLAVSGLTELTIKYCNVNAQEEFDDIFTMQTYNFMISGNHDYEPTEHLDIANYNQLLKQIASCVSKVETCEEKVDEMMTPTLIGTTIVYQNEIVFDYTGQKYLAILTFGNTTTMIPLYNLQDGVMYKTQGTFIYDIMGSAKTTTINYRYDEETEKLTIWSGDNNYHFTNGYTAYLFGIKLY